MEKYCVGVVFFRADSLWGAANADWRYCTRIAEQVQSRKACQLKPKTRPLLLQGMRQKELGAENKMFLQRFMDSIAYLLEEHPTITKLLASVLK